MSRSRTPPMGQHAAPQPTARKADGSNQPLSLCWTVSDAPASTSSLMTFSAACAATDGLVRLQQQRRKLFSLYHAASCKHPADSRTPCSDLLHCSATKRLYNHVVQCRSRAERKQDEDCTCIVPNCHKMRSVLNHYRNCHLLENCPICSVLPGSLPRAPPTRNDAECVSSSPVVQSESRPSSPAQSKMSTLVPYSSPRRRSSPTTTTTDLRWQRPPLSPKAKNTTSPATRARKMAMSSSSSSSSSLTNSSHSATRSSYSAVSATSPTRVMAGVM